MKRRKIRTTSNRPQPAVDDNSREQMLAWLQWNDPNGCYEDSVSIHERRPCLTLNEARELYNEAVAGLGPLDFEPEPPIKTYEEEAQDALRKIANALVGVKPELFAKAYMAEHRTGQQTFARFAWAFFEELAKHPYGDLRNEDARLLARFLVEMVEQHNLKPGSKLGFLRIV